MKKSKLDDSQASEYKKKKSNQKTQNSRLNNRNSEFDSGTKRTTVKYLDVSTKLTEVKTNYQHTTPVKKLKETKESKHAAKHGTLENNCFDKTLKKAESTLMGKIFKTLTQGSTPRM